MSFSRKKYDKQCLTNQNNNDSSINNYLLNMPENDCDNCFQANPEIRCRIDAQEFNTNKRDDLFAATLPLESKKMLQQRDRHVYWC